MFQVLVSNPVQILLETEHFLDDQTSLVSMPYTRLNSSKPTLLGYKEVQFSSLPFRQAVAKMYKLEVISTSKKIFRCFTVLLIINFKEKIPRKLLLAHQASEG